MGLPKKCIFRHPKKRTISIDWLNDSPQSLDNYPWKRMSNQVKVDKEEDLLQEFLKKADQGDAKKQNEISINFMLKFGITALLYASMNGFTDIAKQQLACPCNRVNFQDKDGWTALIWACSAGHSTITRLLLTHPDLDVNVQDKGYSDTALMWACYKGHTRIVRLLLAHDKININLQRNCGTTALTLAAGEGHAEIVQLLLACPGVKVNLRPAEGDTAIMAAAGRGHSDIVRMLLASPGINLRATDYAGKTALDLAANEKCEDLLRLHMMATTLYHRQSSPPTLPISSMASIPDAPNITVRPPPVPRTAYLPRTHSINSNANANATTATSTSTSISTTTTTTATTAATIAATATVTTTSSATSPAPHQQKPPTDRPTSWLAARLLASGYDLATARDCERRLVLQEGFALESDFADCLSTELNRAYLTSIGITGLGTQKRLLALHNELHSQRRSLQTTSAPPLPLPPLSAPDSSSSLPVAQNVTDAVVRVAAGTIEDDNSFDPVFVELPVSTDESALDPVFVEPMAKRSKVTDNESVHECKQS